MIWHFIGVNIRKRRKKCKAIIKLSYVYRTTRVTDNTFLFTFKSGTASLLPERDQGDLFLWSTEPKEVVNSLKTLH